ncbi:sugar-binding transcriptional regulator [Bacillus kexueae]|uniref:sugar-binding transcriptional regulator n=1 Tax=Aeribacillus kexueae TaxID=2078952 RepID=UPI001FAE8158|nr:sugar-binding transcriptional regulator [Bacillus kexueae]
MKSIIEVQKKLLPDLLQIMQKRVYILQHIRVMQPVGRRSLSNNLGISERVLRGEVQFLKEQDLIHIHPSGMTLTEQGAELLPAMEEMVKEVSGLSIMEEKLKRALNLKEVIVVSGDSDQSPWVKKELGRACVQTLNQRLEGNETIAVAGGTTLAAVADMMTPSDKQKHTLFVPARGGLGENVENQANTICAKMAKRAQSNYRLLHVPDQLSVEAYQSIIEEPTIRDLLHVIRSSNIVLHGIGDAKTMADRRRTPHDDVEKIEQLKAVGEAFGYYFNQEGEVVHKVQTAGIQLDDLKNIPCVIAVAGGASKAKAIKAYMKQAIDHILITDEGAAKELLREL